MSLTSFEKAHIALGIAQDEVIRLHGVGIFKAIPPHYAWTRLDEKRATCSAVQAYFEALAEYEDLEKEYIKLHQSK